MKPRRLTFQLTPLLDLLLIVIFAQYMEVQQKAESAQAELKQQQQDLADQFQQGRQALEQQFQQREQQLAANQQQVEREREEYRQQFENIVQQHQQAGSAIADALNLPGRLVEQVMRLNTSGDPQQARNVDSAGERLSQAIEARGSEMVRWLLRFNEMQKHVSIWEVHVLENGQALLSDGEQQARLSFSSQDEFVTQAFEASKAFTEPKPLVIILLSWGNPQAIQRRRATDGMLPLVERLRADAGNTRWFDFSLMGYQATGPVLQQTTSPAAASGPSTSDETAADLEPGAEQPASTTE
ncbi:MAG: hypothetical protein Fues2KO_49880 [Fuerstiella sp.]